MGSVDGLDTKEMIKHFKNWLQARLTEIIEEKDSTISRRENAVKTITEELIKANDIIRKLQTDIRTLNQKVSFFFPHKYLIPTCILSFFST